MAFEYERKEYQDNLENIKRIGTYQDYENAIYEMNVLRNNLQKELGEMFFIDGIASVIDQVDNLYYGDIAFHTNTLLDKSQACLVAGNICGILSRYGEKCYDWKGIRLLSNCEENPIEWDKVEQFDNLYFKHIVRDCIL